MARVWVVNASPAIVLAKIGRLDLLERLADDVLLADVVAAELMAGPEGDPARTAVAGGWGTRVAPDTVPTEIIEWGLGPGESAVIALTSQRNDAVAVLDDAEARACARAMNVPVTGTLGLVARGFRAGLVSSLKETIDKLRKAGLFVDDRLVATILRWAGTLPEGPSESR